MARRSRQPASQEQADLTETIARFFDDPLGYVLFAFPWGQPGTSLHDEDGPDEWQVKVLVQIGQMVRERQTLDLGAIRIAVGSGHGIGKTALVAWIILWFLSTRANPQIVVTANTKTQLDTKTWRELSKWLRLAINGDWFQKTATKCYLKGRDDTWFASAIAWTKERAQAFAGTHEKHVLMIFDEASQIADPIWDTAEGAMTTPGAMWIAFGNPTENTGRFRECFRGQRHRWWTMQVDSRDAKKANQKQIKEWIEDYGLDSDFVRIRVRGVFPRSAATQLIPLDLVEQAMRREPVVHATDPVILTVDVARFGDDQTVIGRRQGFEFKVHKTYRGLSIDQVAFHAAAAIDELEPDAVFVDESGMGAGVVDLLRGMGYEVEGVNGAMSAIEDDRFYNRRTEMWWSVLMWLKRGGCMDEDNEMRDDLTGPTYGYARRDCIQLETKTDMKARNLPSPDKGDALAMSFFMPVAKRIPEAELRKQMAKKQANRPGSWMAY